MINKNDAKLIRSLAIKKYRQKYNNYIVEGEKSVLEAISYRKADMYALFCSQEFAEKYKFELMVLSDIVQIVSQKQLSNVTSLTTNNSVIAIMKMPIENDHSHLNKSRFLVYLDGITDPGNMGTIMRTCEWFGVDALVCSKTCVDIYNPKVIQATMGSIFRFPVFIMDIEELLEKTNKHYKNLYLMALDGKNLYETDMSFPMIVIIGSESHGPSEISRKLATGSLTIPGAGTAAESLNAAVACSIVISEIYRRSEIVKY